jgi:ABC-type arginine transport system permease subunit
MPPAPTNRRSYTPLWRAVIEIVFIVFLFYSNLLMGEFTASNGRGKSLAFALHDIFTCTNFVIGMIAALIGYVLFERLRKKF